MALVGRGTAKELEIPLSLASVVRRTLACLVRPMICSSVNLLFFVSVILLVVDGLH